MTRTIVVTGAARGIGASIAQMFREEDYHVAAADLNFKAFEHVGHEWLKGPCDASEGESVRRFVEKTEQVLGPVDILVNNVGIYPIQPFLSISIEDWRRVMSTNVESVVNFCQSVLPGMRERGWGRVINIASNTFFMGLPNFAHYIASKGAVIGLSRSLAAEFGPHGITVNCVAPNFTRTEGTAIVEREAPEVVAQTVASQAIPRVALPTDVLGAISFLASDRSAFMTGQTLVVDGGTVKH
ncbi:MAG: SDR family oxidoreductase [Rhodospirillaceae bacterium]|nr:SDR family oxidoreductase [Rhodospirillaceae bacterium]